MSQWSPPADAAEWTPPSNAMSADETISSADPKKVAAYTQFSERLSRTAPLGIGEHAAAHGIPEEDRGLFAAIAEKQYNADQSMKKVGYGTRLATSVAQGAIDWGMPLAKLTGAVPSLTPEQERYKQHLLGIRQSTDPTIRPDTNIVGRGVQQASQMAFPMVQSVGAAKALGGAAKFLGWAPKTVAAATAVGASGSFLPQTADQTYTSLIGEGVHPDRARAITAVSAPIESAIESILPDPFTGYGAAFRGTARQVAMKLVKQYTVNFTKELTEEGLQGIVNEAALEVGRRMDETIPDKGLGNILQRGVTEMQQAAVPLALMVAPGAAVEGTQVARESAARPARLAQLKEIRAKGYVSAEDGQLAGVAGETRKERLANADAEIKQLEQEIQNASTVPSPQAEVRQPESGQDLRGQGQNQAPAEPAGEVPQVRVEPQAVQPPPPAPAGELYDQAVAAVREKGRASVAVLQQKLGVPYKRASELLDAMEKGGVIGPHTGEQSRKVISESSAAETQPVDERKAMLDALGAAEAAATEQPKRDVSAEIRDALAQGPVTVSTPQVQSGFKVSKVRDDGRVVTNHGKIITPDETWVINPPKPAEAVAPQQPAVEQPTINNPQSGKEVTNGQEENQGQGRKGVLTPETPPIEKAAVGEVPKASPAAVPKRRGRKDQRPAKPDHLSPVWDDNVKAWVSSTHANQIWDSKANGWRSRTVEEGFKPTQPEPPAVEKPRGEYDFENTFPTPTEAAQRELRPGDHYPDPSEDKVSHRSFFKEVAGEYNFNLAEAERGMEEANSIRQTGRRSDGKKPIKNRPEEIKRLESHSRDAAAMAENKLSEIENIYGEDAANRFKEWATKGMGQEKPAAPVKLEPPVEAPPQAQETKPTVEEPIPPQSHHVAEYGGKLVPIDYVADKKNEFKVAAQRVRDNLKTGEIGYVTAPDGKRYEITTDSRMAKPVASEKPFKLEQPHPALDKAGIKLKATPKGWSVTGISKEIADGISTDYQGKRTGKGYFFKKDPTAGLIDAARTITAEAERDAAERAAGRVKTSIGYHSPEVAQEYEQAKAERLTLAKEELSRRNDSVDELVSQFVGNGQRGKFKLKLLHAAEHGDSDTLKRFDEMVQYAKDHPELSLPTDEHRLFTLLSGESFTKSDSELSDEIDNELAAEIEKELGDTSFDFGENAQEQAIPESKQTAIPGTEEAVADRKRREEIKESNKQFKTVKAKQTAFISGMDTDLPGQGTMFNVDGAGGTDTAADVSQLTSKTTLQQAADKAVQEAHDELDSFGKMLGDKGLFSNPMLDPEVIAGAGRVVAKFVKAGTLKFAALMEHLAKSIGQAAVDRIRPALESEWDRLQKSNSGMEPRTPETQAEKPPPGGHELTGIKKEVVNDLRSLVGLPEMEGSTPQTVEEWAENARITLAADPKAGIRLVNELAMNARPITQSDAMLLQFRYRQLANELAPVVDDYFEAVKSKDPVAIATSKSAVTDARKAMTDFEETIHPSKETWGRTGVALQQMLRKDFSIEAVLRRGQEANDGEELSPDQTAELTAMAKKFQDLQGQFEAERKRSEELEAELASKRQHEEAVTSVKQEKVRRKSGKRQAAEKKVADAWEKFRQAANSTAGSSGANLIGPAVDVAKAYVELGYVRFSEFIAAARQNIPGVDEKLFRQAWDQATGEAGIEAGKLDPSDRAELSKAAREIQRELVENGMTDREKVIDAVHEALQEELPELTRRQTMDALSRYGIFQRQSQNEIEKLIRGMNSEILKLSQIDQMETAMKRVDELRAEGKTDEEIGKALDKEKLLVEATGLVRDRPSQTVRQLTQKYNELKKSIPATPSGKAGMLQTTLNQMERALRNRISDLKFEIDRREKVVKEKRERPTSETIKSLESERDSLVKIHKEMFPPKKPSEAQRIASAIRGSDKAIAQLEKQISTQDFDVEAKPTLSSPELDARRARLEQLRAARKALKAMEVARMEGEGGHTTGKAPLSDAELARRAYESSLRSRIADYQQLLAEGDFSPKPKKPPRTLTESELKLKREMADVRHEVLQKYADYHLAHLKGIAWGADKIAEAAHLSRALMTSFDLSALLRQGGLAALGHPAMAKNAMVETVASIAHTFDSANAKALLGGVNLENAKKFLATIDSRQAEFDLMHKLTEGPAGELRSKAGLNLPSSDQQITRQEEAFQGRWGKHVPGIALSSRLYTMILNKMRADLFDSMVHNLGRDGQVTMDEAKLIASFVNVATGRSDLKMFNRAAATLNTVFFAPRYVASRFQYLAMPFYLPLKGGLNQNWRAKRAIYQEFGRTAAGIATVLGLFALIGRLLYDDDDKDRPQVEPDPRSADFLKVKIGETRLDFLAGLTQVLVLSSRMAVGQTKSSVTGKVRNFGEGFEPPTRMSVLTQFGRTKFAPVPGAIATIADDWTNVVGKKETLGSMARSIVTPLSLEDVATVIEDQGIAKGTAMSILSTLGVGMNTYGPRTEYATGTPEERQSQIEKDLKNMQWDSPEQPAYSEFLTGDQLEQFRQRRQEKRGLVVYNATYTGTDEDEIKTRDKNREYLDRMGVSKDEALQLLKDYYKAKEGGLRVHGGTGLKPGYAKRIGGLNSIYGK